MPTFRAYTPQEIQEAAQAYGIDPDFADVIYAAESSRGTDPKALEPRSVKRKRDSTIVRGPFQLEDGTTHDLIRKHKLGNVDIDDPDVHLDLAMRLMQDLQKRYNGDMSMMARAYLGFGTDELGTSDKKYASKVMAEIDKIKAKKQKESPLDVIDVVPMMNDVSPPPMPGLSDLNIASNEPDIFGYTPPSGANQGGLGGGMNWGDLVAAGNRGGVGGSNVFALPQSMAVGPGAQITDDMDVHAYIQSLVEDELGSKEFANAG